jgi:F-type H+-transporting ATPase subunit delta
VNDVADDTNTASVAGRYASALFELAREQRQIETVEKDLTSFAAMLEGSEDLTRLVRSPVFSSEDQGKALTAILTKAGIGGLTANFLKLLAKNRRLFAAGDMIKSFRAIAARERGEVIAEVTSAHPLSAEQLNTLRDTLKTASQGKSMNIQAKVDPTILGGLIVKIGSRMVDSSLKTKLSTLKVAMKGTG